MPSPHLVLALLAFDPNVCPQLPVAPRACHHLPVPYTPLLTALLRNLHAIFHLCHMPAPHLPWLPSHLRAPASVSPLPACACMPRTAPHWPALRARCDARLSTAPKHAPQWLPQQQLRRAAGSNTRDPCWDCAASAVVLCTAGGGGMQRQAGRFQAQGSLAALTISSAAMFLPQNDSPWERA